MQDIVTTHGGLINEEYDYIAMSGTTYENITKSYSNVVMTSNPAYIQAYNEHSNSNVK